MPVLIVVLVALMVSEKALIRIVGIVNRLRNRQGSLKTLGYTYEIRQDFLYSRIPLSNEHYYRLQPD